MLDACLLHGTKLLLAGDGHPNRFKAFSRALSSRCVSGMVVHIESPDVNTRLAIVNHLASRRGLRLEPAAAELVVERTLGTVRELEGALTRLDAMARLEGTGETIGLQLVTRTLGAAAAPTGSTGRCCQCGMRGPEHSPPRTSWQQPAPTHHLGSRGFGLSAA